VTKQSTKSSKGQARKVWLYIADGRYPTDLASLDGRGYDTWQGNRLTRAGDLVVMYRTAPYSDIAYVFVAKSDARRTTPEDGLQWKYIAEIADGYRLPRVIPREELENMKGLSHWDFLSHSRGAALRLNDLQEQGVWPTLRKAIERRAPGIAEHFGRAWTGRGGRRYAFVSYSSHDRARVNLIHDDMKSQGIDLWLDSAELETGEDWDEKIRAAMARSKAIIICLSPSWLRRRSYVKQELKFALEFAKLKKIPLFPIMIEKCAVPEALRGYHVTSFAKRNTGAAQRDFVRSLRQRISNRG
jgi:hypothetical protein